VPQSLVEGQMRPGEPWLATSDDQLARSTGKYFYHQKLREPNPIGRDLKTQDELLAECARISGVPFPEQH